MSTLDRVIIDLTGENGSDMEEEKEEESTPNINFNNNNNNNEKRNGKVWLVCHHKEPYYQSAFSYDYHLDYGPSSIDKVIVGVYTNEKEAKISCRDYFDELGYDCGEGGGEDPDDVDNFNEQHGFFYDACSLTGDSNEINERVYVEEHCTNRNPQIRR